MSRRVVFLCSCGTGTDTAEAYIVSSELSDEELDTMAWDLAKDNAESFGLYEPDWDSDEEDADSVQYTDNGMCWDDVQGYWEDYCAEKHDGKLIRGNDKEVDWYTL